jgi:type IV pilus assembly protein PilX
MIEMYRKSVLTNCLAIFFEHHLDVLPYQKRFRRVRAARHQDGAALMVSLILLLVMTMIGVTAVSTTTLEEKMAGNLRDRSLAFQAAEAGLRDAETSMSPLTLFERPFPCQSSSTCKVIEKNFLPTFSQWDWEDVNLYTEYTPLDSEDVIDLKEVKTYPRYVIEELDFVPDELGIGHGVVPGRHYYRITARGTGGTDVAQAVIETSYTRRY